MRDAGVKVTARKGGAAETGVAPKLCAPTWPSPGRSLLRERDPRGTEGPVHRAAAQGAMADAGWGPWPWPPRGLLLQVAALLGTLGPQVRELRRTRSLRSRVPAQRAGARTRAKAQRGVEGACWSLLAGVKTS